MTTSSSTNVKKKFIPEIFSGLNFEQIEKEFNFCKRKPKKINLLGLLTSFFQMALKRENSYSLFASFLGEYIGDNVSKVALWKRINNLQILCLQVILEETFNVKLNPQKLHSVKEMVLYSPFSNVYIQDSTIISLPDELSIFYKGSVSKGKQKSSARIQAIYELKENKYKEFNLGSFTDNDQGSSGNILKIIKKGDLIIRDLGYFVLKVFKGIEGKEAFYISRYLYGVNIFNEQTKEKLKLTNILNKNIVDINVIVGNKDQLKCRLVAVKIPEEIANERRRKAKHNRDKRVNYSTEYYHALGWVIYITNIEREVYGYKEIMAAYRSRWQIEIIFKTWKSNFNIENLIPEKPKANKSTTDDLKKYNHRIETIIYMMLIFIVLFQLQIYLYFVYRILEKHQKFISLLKLTKFVALNIERILVSKNLDEFESEIAYYTTHEKRKKRQNMLERHLLYDYYEY